MNAALEHSLMEHILECWNRGASIEAAESEALFTAILRNPPEDGLLKALLSSLARKGETREELKGALAALRKAAVPFPLPATTAFKAIDTCGTGGDKKGMYNISTAVAFVVAACGVPVVKHGNRAVSSSSGSADVLSALGIRIDAPTDVMQRCVEQTHFCFLFAPLYHPAMKQVAAARKELGIRTIFNLMGPLANPAGLRRQLVGVSSEHLLQLFSATLRDLDHLSAWVVHGASGEDEISVCGKTHVAQLSHGTLTSTTIDPETLGLDLHPESALVGGDAIHNARAIRDLFTDMPVSLVAFRDSVLLNAAAALVIATECSSLEEGLERARKALTSGAALQTLDNVIRCTA